MRTITKSLLALNPFISALVQLGGGKNKTITLILLGASILFISWQESTEITLSKAGKNRQELQSVLLHFKNDPDSLKLRSAKFLIPLRLSPAQLPIIWSQS